MADPRVERHLAVVAVIGLVVAAFIWPPVGQVEAHRLAERNPNDALGAYGQLLNGQEQSDLGTTNHPVERELAGNHREDDTA